MASLTFTDIAEVSSKGRSGGSFLVQVSGDGVAIDAVVYSGILNEDVDGAPQCYGRFPADAGIDRLRHGTNLVGGGVFKALPAGMLTHPWKWVGVVNMTHAAAVAAGILNRLDERPELAGRFNENAPMNNPDFRRSSPCFIPTTTSSTSRRRHWCATPHFRKPTRGTGGTRQPSTTPR